MESNSLPELVEEVKVWTKKLSMSCAEVVASLEKVGSSEEELAEKLRKDCGAVATSMTQLVAFCHKAQNCASSTKDAGSFVSTMNGFVVACIALTKGLIKMAKTAMGKKDTALSETSLAEARSLLSDLQNNCNKIARCAAEVIARSPKPARRKSKPTVSASTSPVTSPRGDSAVNSLEVDRLVIGAIKEVMEKKEVLTTAMRNEDAVDFVSKAKELVSSFSSLKKATLRHSRVSAQFGAEKLSTMLSAYVRAAKSHFQAPNDTLLRLEYKKGNHEFNAMLKEMTASLKPPRSTTIGGGQRPVITNPRRATLAPGTISISSGKITITRVSPGDRAKDTMSIKESVTVKKSPVTENKAEKKAEDSEMNASPHEAEKLDIAELMTRQLEEEELRVEEEIRLKKEEAEKKRLEEQQRAEEEKEKQRQEEETLKAEEEERKKKEEEERKKKEEEAEKTRQEKDSGAAEADTMVEAAAVAVAEAEAEADAEAEAEAEAAAIAAIEAGFEEAEKNALSPTLACQQMMPSKENSAQETDELLQSMLEPGTGWLPATASSEEPPSGSPVVRTKPFRPRLASAASREEAKAAALACSNGGEDATLKSSAELIGKDTGLEEEEKDTKLPAKMPVMKKNVTDKSKTGADIVIGKLMDIYPQFKEIFEGSARAGMVKDLINDDLLLVDTLRRNVTVTGRGGDECQKLSKAITTVMVAIHCYISGLDSCAKGSDERRENVVKDSYGDVLRTLLVILDALGDHAQDTVPAKLLSQSLEHLTNVVVTPVEAGAPSFDEHVLNACKVHTVGLIESQLRENLFDLTRALHGKTVQLLHTMKIVFSGAMVEFNAWVELCAVFAGVVSQLEAVIACTQTLAEVVRQRRTNFSRFSSTEELDVEELVNIFIWNEGDSPPPSKGSKIKTGTLNQLVSYLTSDQKIDNAFLRTFVCTYRSFSTPVQLLEKLQERFTVPPHLQIGREEAIQLRVCVTLKYWVQNQFPDFDDALIVRLFAFLNQVEEAGHSAMAEGIRQQLKEKMEERASQMHSRGNLLPCPLVLSSKPSLVSDYLEQHSPLDVAKQLTLIDFSIFSLIRPAELMNQAWTSKKLSHRAMHVCTFMNRVNNLSNWVATLILSRNTLASRIKTMQFLVEVAVQLRNMNNYHSLMGIVAGTNVSAISRLKHTRDGLGKDLTKKMASLEQLMHPSGSFKHYRKHLASSKYPVIPYLGVYLTDLVFIEDGNPDEVDGFINFEKRELAFAPVEAVQTAQGEGYTFPKCEPLYSTLFHLCQLDEELLWMLSQAAEPRNCLAKDIK